MAKKKRKNNAPHARRAAPAERRQVVSYDDIEGEAAPPIPRQRVSYGSDSNDDEGEQAPDQRHAVVSKEALRERERPQTDVTYGQQGAFPGLDPRDKEPFYGPANDGLDYLRMVRSEARGIPHVVSAPPPKPFQPTDYEDDDYEEHVDDYGGYYEEESDGEDEGGYYEDGAYVAPPIVAPIIGPVQSGMKAQDAFYRSLTTRFETLRRNLRSPPSVQAVQGLDDKHPISLPFGNKMADKEWKYHLVHTTPLPAQLASLDSPSILRLLKLVEGQLENCRKTNIPHNLSLWAWSLLAKLENVGLLQTRDVSVVRDLAKMAVWVRMMHHKSKYGRSNDPDYEHLDHYPEENAAQQEQEEGEVVDEKSADAEAGAPEDEPVGAAEPIDAAVQAQIQEEITAETGNGDAAMDLDSEDQLLDAIAARKRQLQTEAEAQEKEQKSEEFPDTNTCLTIDMLVTVASEFYGQKDLLVGRLAWDHPTD
ncbi:hypothetical protein D6C86_03976 [Aureobasidium pullulans]|uniref:Uncharacterized protein n=1 Tax=Aureobasidium pullulans TaxID=5580 RepID=A0A4S9PRS7_AURPU|nr:hypothetical protein D6C94_05752 [Aureobasidium pullulans]THZ41846.1 hypothetical protein D6C87_05459 [Aureobasidium pullulans]THZ62021.1 hypothetical protein D6C86_03976 [Aureobasidium pullulans]